MPSTFALLQNQPNPFGATTRIRFELPQQVRVRLKIFDLQGRVVRSLSDAVYGPGRWSAEWNRRDDRGSVAPSGVYLYRIEAGQFQSRRKMVLLP